MREIFCICGQLVSSDIERNEHILSHFEQSPCNGCGYDLIFIAGKWYQPHNCSSIVKQELDYDDNVTDQDLLAIVEHNVKVESIELPTSLEFCTNINDPLIGTDQIERIVVSECNALDDNLLVKYLPSLEQEANSPNQLQVQPESEPYSCEVCSISFSLKPNHDKHMLKYHPEHMKREGQSIRPHVNTGSKAYRCRLCPAAFNHRQNRFKHMKIVHGEFTLSSGKEAGYRDRAEGGTLSIQTRSRNGSFNRLITVTSSESLAELSNESDHEEQTADGMPMDGSDYNDDDDMSDSSDSADETYQPQPSKRRLSHKLNQHETSQKVLPMTPNEANCSNHSTLPVTNRTESKKFRSGDIRMWSCRLCSKKMPFKHNMYRHIRSAHNLEDKSLAIPSVDQGPVARKRVSQAQLVATAEDSYKKSKNLSAGTDERSKSARPTKNYKPSRFQSVQLFNEGVQIWSCGLCSKKMPFKHNMYRHIRTEHRLDDKTLAIPIISEEFDEETEAKQQMEADKLEDRSLEIPVLDEESADEIESQEYVNEEANEGLNDLDGEDDVSESESFQSNKSRDDDFIEDKESEHSSSSDSADGSQLPVGSNKPPKSTKIRGRDVKMWSCGVCQRKMAFRTNMYRHIRAIHGMENKTLAIPLVDWDDSIELPPIANDSDPIECKLCSKCLPNKKKLERHMHLWHDSNPRTTKCEYCSQNFDDKLSLDIHKRALHADRLDEYRIKKCAKCPELFQDYYVRRLHIIQKHCGSKTIPQRQFKCCFCEQTFKRIGFLVSHLAEHGPHDEYKCCVNSCENCFKNIDELRAHLKNHVGAEGDKQECNKCKRSFTEWGFHIHKCVTRYKEKVRICDYCGKQFNRLHTFQEHMNRHMGAKIFKCSYCPNAFAGRSNWAKHERTHTGEKPCKCNAPNCDRAFTQHTDLYRHQYKAHGIFRKKFPCTVCQEVLPENALLRKHLLAYHGISPT